MVQCLAFTSSKVSNTSFNENKSIKELCRRSFFKISAGLVEISGHRFSLKCNVFFYSLYLRENGSLPAGVQPGHAVHADDVQLKLVGSSNYYPVQGFFSFMEYFHKILF